MAAILALDAAVIEEVTADIDGVWIANYNCPGQIVISGKKAAVEEACEKLKAAGAKRAEITSPVFTTVPDTSVARIGTQTVTYGGVEND